MALTRRFLKGMGLTEEQIETIIEAHTDTVEGLKADVAKYKADAEALPEVQSQLQSAKNDLEAEKKSGWKDKYNTLKEEYEGYKNEQTAKATRAAKEEAYRNLLKTAGVSEKRLASVLKVSDIDGIELAEDGSVQNAKALTESIKNEWADFIVSETTQGANTNTPPANTPGGARTSRAARIAAEYHNNLYGSGKE